MACIRPPVGYRFVKGMSDPGEVSEVSPIGGWEAGPGSLYDYLVGAGGVYLSATREEFKVRFRIGACDVRGLAEIEEGFEWNVPPAPAELVDALLRKARSEALEDREVLFHLLVSDTSGWTVLVPPQQQGRTHCKPLDSGPESSHGRALIEVHSHHNMPAFFSATDDADEGGFRIYGVVGRVLEGPEIRVRVGCHGYFWEIPADWVMELPQGMKDLAEESEDEEGC